MRSFLGVFCFTMHIAALLQVVSGGQQMVKDSQLPNKNHAEKTQRNPAGIFMAAEKHSKQVNTTTKKVKLDRR